MKFRLSQTIAGVMLYSLLLISLVSASKVDRIPCVANNSCSSDSLCCGSLDGKQWCCHPGQNCCLNEDGCCPFPFSMKSPLQDIDYSTKEMKPNRDIAKSRNALKFHNPGKLREYKKRQKCDKESKFFCGKREKCCKGADFWECCPYTNGTCCGGNYCCPPGTTCDSTNYMGCRTNAIFSKMGLQMKPSTRDNAQQYILCPDDERLCLDTNTCCLIANGTYGCCPYENAVCCSDLLHCCPPLSVCNTEMLTCEPDDRNPRRKEFPRLAKMV